jgi:pyruvate dehydrogenase E1 component beta subunit
MVLEAVRARQILERIGISAEVIDLRTLKPIDEAVILESVMKTGRLVIADTGWRSCGVAAEIAAIVAEKGFKYLRAPIRRVTLPDIPTPTSRALEEMYYPGFKEIVESVCEVLDIEEKLKIEVFAASEKFRQSPEKLFLGPF